MTLAKYLQCFKCKKTYSPYQIIFQCEECGGPLDVYYDYHKISKNIVKNLFIREQIRHWKYWPFFPVSDLDKAISMNEGGTPLIQSNDEKNFMFKYEGVNPTCSFKDRGSAVEISKAKEFGVKEVVCASTGNMGASVAAYCARAGIKATIYVPKFAPRPKVHQIKMMGARVMIVNGSYEDALNMTKKLNEKRGIYLVGDYPYREEGEKSVTFEILDQLNFIPPKYIVYPMGNAVLIAAAYKACMEFKEVGLIRKMPKLVGIQAEGCRPLVNAFKTGVLSQQINTHTIATAIDCGNPTNGLEALDGMEKTKGIAEFVTDREIISALKKLGKQGIYVEPAGAVSYAGAMKLGLEGKTVCVLTGHGLKDSRLF